MEKEYVLGLVDGEGCFNVRVNRQRRRARVELKFSLKLRHQDKEILEQLKSFFDCGNIYIQRDKRPNHEICYRFEVNNKKDIINKIIPFFERYPLLSIKQKSFRLFAKIIEMVIKGKHRTNGGIKQIIKLAYQMNANGKYRLKSQKELLKGLESSETICRMRRGGAKI